jgi:hypothetical protein
VTTAVALVSLECLVAVQALLAYRDHFLTLTQMRHRGIDHGLPFVWHFAMWGDLLIVSPLAAYLVGRYFHQWRVRWMLLSLAIGFAFAGLLSWLYTFSGMPEAHIQNHRLTAAGVGHLIYMGITLSVFLQFFIFTQETPIWLLRLVSVLLLFHVFIGNHMALGLLDAVSKFDWYPGQPLKSFFGWATIAAVAVALFWRNFDVVVTFENATRRVAKFLRHL